MTCGLLLTALGLGGCASDSEAGRFVAAMNAQAKQDLADFHVTITELVADAQRELELEAKRAADARTSRPVWPRPAESQIAMPEPPKVFCYRSLGQVTCHTEPDPLMPPATRLYQD
jgi:hypothetical protein